MDPGLIELFVDGKEDGLPDSGRLDGLGLGEGSVVFLLFRQGWRWTACGSEMALSDDGLVATVGDRRRARRMGSDEWQLATGGEPMTEGRHYWEVEITSGSTTALFGAARPGLDHDEAQHDTDDAYFINAPDGSLWGNTTDFIDAYNGGLWGNGEGAADQQDVLFAEGDRVGVLLDLDAGWMRFYRGGKRCGPGFTGGVTGPLVRAAQVGGEGDTLTVLPGAVAPEGAGSADEPWDEPEPESEAVY
jgi:hypothetical protein